MIHIKFLELEVGLFDIVWTVVSSQEWFLIVVPEILQVMGFVPIVMVQSS